VFIDRPAKAALAAYIILAVAAGGLVVSRVVALIAG